MTLGELRDSLSRFPRDMDDLEMIIISDATGPGVEFDSLGAVAMPDTEDQDAVILLTSRSVRSYAARGKARMQDGTPVDLTSDTQ